MIDESNNPLKGIVPERSFWMPDHVNYFTDIAKCPVLQDINFDRYTVFDMETTGVSSRQDFATQLGWLDWRDGVVESSGCILLKLPDGAHIPEKVQEITGITDELCARDGVERHEAIAMLLGLLHERWQAGNEIVGHNAIQFDFEMLKSENERLPAQHQVNVERIQSQCIDTGMLAKACQIYAGPFAGAEKGMLPGFAEERIRYFKRVGATRSKVKWSLTFCMNFFQIDPACLGDGSLHNAETDCRVTHYLMQKYRAMMGRSAA